MYCPRCGQETISDEMSYCPRCGLPLEYVAEMLEGSGVPAERRYDEGEPRVFSRRNGRILALCWFVFFVCFVAPVSATLEDNLALIILSLITGIMGSLFITAFAQFLPAKGKRRLPFRSPGRIPDERDIGELPPHQTEFAEDYVSPRGNERSRYETGDFERPPSVTENTTKLLEQED